MAHDEGDRPIPSLADLARVRGGRPSRRGAPTSLEASTASLGGKGARLVWLVHHGFRVPDAFIIPADVFDRVARSVLPPGHDIRSLLRLAGTREGIERAGRAHARLREAPTPRWLTTRIEEVWRALEPDAPWGVAVRSSATCEDGAVTSLAGLASTRLGARGVAEILDGVREVWASLLLPRALSYLSGLDVHHASMAVVVQRMVEADASGVCTASEPPLFAEAEGGRGSGSGGGDGARSRGRAAARSPGADRRSIEILVNATYGLGAPVVAGVATPDVLRVRGDFARLQPEPASGSVGRGRRAERLERTERNERRERPRRADGADPAGDASVESPQGTDPGVGAVTVLEQTIAYKPRALVVGPSGNSVVDVDPAKRRLPALSPRLVEELAQACARLVSLGPGPWEVELAAERGELWLLQARPVIETGVPEGGDAETVWSCANLAEALPGVATPLTWSVASTFSEVGFRRAFAALGAVVPRGTRFVTNVQGRFYLNLTAFMRVAATVPGLDPATLLELGGGDGASILAAQVEGVSRRGFYARLPLTGVRFVREQLRLDADLAAYERAASRSRAAFEALDLGILTDEGVATTLRDLQRDLDRTGALMLTCASNSLGSFVALRALLARLPSVSPSMARRLAEDLTSGGALKGWGELESARPTTALVRVAEIALRDPGAREALGRTPPPKLDEIPPGPARDALDRWIAAYGDRAVREAELATPRWREDPSFPIATLALYVGRLAAGLPCAGAAEEVGARAEDARQKVEPAMSLVERTLLRHLTARSLKFARLRERMRSWVTWVLGAIRVASLEADRRLARRDPTLGHGDIFMLTLDEVLATLRGEPRSIGRIVALRRAEYFRDLARPDPPTTFVGRPSPVRVEALGGPLLRGHGASPGVVRGPVRLLSSPGEAARIGPGDILVTRTTDIGWTPLFVVAAGVVTELGGPLSHAAIVARELNVPCVVNASGATVRLRDGDVVRLDGDQGTVELAESADRARGEQQTSEPRAPLAETRQVHETEAPATAGGPVERDHPRSWGQ